MQMKQVLMDNRWSGDTGIGRLCREVIKYAPEEVNCSFVSSSMGLGNMFSPLMLAREIKKSGADVFYSPSFMPPLYSSVPFIFTVHDLMHLFYYSGLHRFYYQQVIARLAKKAKTVITVSHFSKQQLVDLLKIKEESIKVIYNGVDEAFSANKEVYFMDRPYFLYVGNRRKNKNLPAMLTAFAQANIPQEFIFILTGNPDPELMELLETLGITDRVRFFGFVNEADLPKLYKGAYATLFVSLMEGFGLPLIESMASGTPVLTSNESALPEIAENAALCVPPSDVGAIAKGIERLVKDKKLYEEFVDKGYERARAFSWKATAEETWNVILS